MSDTRETCRYCRKPMANAQDCDTFEPGEGEHLCWHILQNCDQDQEEAIDLRDAEIARLERELAETAKDYRCLAELLDGHDATECRANLVRLKADLAAAKRAKKQAEEQRDAAKKTRAELLRHLDAARENERKAQLQLVLAQQMHEAERAIADRLAGELRWRGEAGGYGAEQGKQALAAWEEARK